MHSREKIALDIQAVVLLLVKLLRVEAPQKAPLPVASPPDLVWIRCLENISSCFHIMIGVMSQHNS